MADLVLPDFSGVGNKRAAIARFVADHLHDFDVRRIVSVPYFHEDVLASLVAKGATGAPLVVLSDGRSRLVPSGGPPRRHGGAL